MRHAEKNLPDSTPSSVAYLSTSAYVFIFLRFMVIVQNLIKKQLVAKEIQLQSSLGMSLLLKYQIAKIYFVQFPVHKLAYAKKHLGIF